MILIAHNLRSSHNVGSLLRTAEGLGVQKVYLTGYTPYPLTDVDGRMPHIAAKIDRQITKTALGAQKTQNWEHRQDINKLLEELKLSGHTIAALEQTPTAIELPTLSEVFTDASTPTCRPIARKKA